MGKLLIQKVRVIKATGNHMFVDCDPYFHPYIQPEQPEDNPTGVYDEEPQPYYSEEETQHGGPHLVSFDTGDSTQPIQGIVVGDNATISDIPTPSRTGYDFDGWFTQPNGGTKLTNTTKIGDDTTFYAHWTPIEYAITYITQDRGYVSPDAKRTYTIEDSEYFIPPLVDAYGNPIETFRQWTFLGWEPLKIPSGSTGDLVVESQWELTTYTVSFDSNGGTPIDLVLRMTYGQFYGDLPIPTREGYVFDGWWTSDNRRIQQNTLKGSYSDEVLHARWTTPDQGNPYYDSPYYDWDTPYYDDHQDDPSPDDPSQGDDPYYAQIGTETVTLTFNPNGGTMVQTQVILYQNQTLGEAIPGGINGIQIPTREGYEFIGWWTSPTGNGTQITSSTRISASGTVYARWQEVSEPETPYFQPVEPELTPELQQRFDEIDQEHPLPQNMIGGQELQDRLEAMGLLDENQEYDVDSERPDEMDELVLENYDEEEFEEIDQPIPDGVFTIG